MLPDAPVLFSTRNDLPVLALSRWLTRRVTTSTAEAAANGLTRVTGLEGQSCAFAEHASESAKKTKIAFMRKGYLNVPWGQVHFRTADESPDLPLLILLHQSPLS